MNLRDKKIKEIDISQEGEYGKFIEFDCYMSKDVDHHLSNFVNKIVLAKNITKGKIFRILKEEFGEKK